MLRGWRDGGWVERTNLKDGGDEAIEGELMKLQLCRLETVEVLSIK